MNAQRNGRPCGRTVCLAVRYLVALFALWCATAVRPGLPRAAGPALGTPYSFEPANGSFRSPSRRVRRGCARADAKAARAEDGSRRQAVERVGLGKGRPDDLHAFLRRRRSERLRVERSKVRLPLEE